VLTSWVSVCWRIETLVSSGMPGMSFSAMAFKRAGAAWSTNGIHQESLGAGSLDFPDPLRPTRAYLCPAFSLSFALERISVPSALALALPLPAAGLSAEVTVMLRPSMSSYSEMVQT